MQKYSVYSEFDIKQHAKYMIDYLEVVISPEGKISYAVPSHTLFLEKVLFDYCNTHDIDYVKLSESDEAYDDWAKFLCNHTGYCLVWNEFIIKPTRGLTKSQKESLYQLSTTHYANMPILTLYRGKID